MQKKALVFLRIWLSFNHHEVFAPLTVVDQFHVLDLVRGGVTNSAISRGGKEKYLCTFTIFLASTFALLQFKQTTVLS